MALRTSGISILETTSNVLSGIVFSEGWIIQRDVPAAPETPPIPCARYPGRESSRTADAPGLHAAPHPLAPAAELPLERHGPAPCAAHPPPISSRSALPARAP